MFVGMQGLRIIVFIVLTFEISFIAANSSYSSINALDQYGGSPQINNARLASKLHSMPTLVTHVGSSLVAVALEKRQSGIIPRNKCNIIGQSEDTKLATIGSGLASDAAFMNKLLRDDVMHTWERYDCVPACARVTHTASRIFLAFMGYDGEMQDGSMDVLMDGNGERINIGRPFAINLMIARLKANDPVELMMVEPSGVVSTETVGRVLGKGSQKGTELLEKRWKDNMNEEEVEELCIDIVREIALSEHLVGDHGGEEDYNIVIETLDCTKGLCIKRIPFPREEL
jgi:20S proteasome alpha/beta subunit